MTVQIVKDVTIAKNVISVMIVKSVWIVKSVLNVIIYINPKNITPKNVKQINKLISLDNKTILNKK